MYFSYLIRGAALLLAGLCGCDKTNENIDPAMLQGSWVESCAEGVVAAVSYTWTFTNGKTKYEGSLKIVSYDALTGGSSESEYIYVSSINPYNTVQPQLELYASDTDFDQEPTPAAIYYVTECSSKQLVLVCVYAQSGLPTGTTTFLKK